MSPTFLLAILLLISRIREDGKGQAVSTRSRSRVSTRALPRSFQRRTRVDEQASSALLSFLFPQKAWLLPVHLRQAVLFVQPAVTVAPPHADWGTVQTGVYPNRTWEWAKS